ncbi:hypothetical protein TSAR_012904, partial [Trichomalopsis sarcophagae]
TKTWKAASSENSFGKQLLQKIFSVKVSESSYSRKRARKQLLQKTRQSSYFKASLKTRQFSVRANK